ncbi:hypothetical protein Zm00014a_034478 [Zea mays]|uniref:Uncharacterized protein n=1 Tax=Zea mays TaxID=4577 RepID=A0A3L6F700_MAIZE|nr:hypothetical protein Zm00014a_034478 [Zea mays]
MAGRNASHMAMASRSSTTGTAVLCFLVVVSLFLAPSLFVAGTEAAAAYELPSLNTDTETSIYIRIIYYLYPHAMRDVYHSR